MRRGNAVWGLVIYVLFGVYFINFTFNFFPIPEFLKSIESWIRLIAGVLLVIGGINFSRVSNRHMYYR